MPEKTPFVHLNLFKRNVRKFTANQCFDMYKPQLEEFFYTNNIVDPEEKKVLLLRYLCTDTLARLCDLCKKSPWEYEYDQLCKQLSIYYRHPKNLYKNRSMFYKAHKDDTQSVSEWYANVKKLASDCEFGAYVEQILADKFITAIGSEKIFNKLCEENEVLTLEHAYALALKYELQLEKGEQNVIQVHTAENHKMKKRNLFKPYGEKGSSSQKDYMVGNIQRQMGSQVFCECFVSNGAFILKFKTKR